ncbi:MAG: DNA repair protein RecO [Magnetococcus sp. MYC-9]
MLWRTMRCLDEALVLRRTPFRDTSLLLHLFTRQSGLLAAVARGVRATRRGNGMLDRAALAGFHTVLMGRYARSSDSLCNLTSVEIKQARHRLWQQAAASLAAQVMQEILYRFMPPQEPNPGVFELLECAWDQLDAGAEPLEVLALCQGRMMHALGYGWRTDGCAGCGGTTGLDYFSVKRGQVVCERCAAPYIRCTTGRAEQRTPRLFPLTPSLLTLLHHLPWHTALSRADTILLYRIGMACLVRLAGAPLLADAPFRRIAGLEPASSC